MSRIISIGTAVPKYGTRQSAILDFMQKAYNDETASRMLKILFNHSGINTRYSVIPDFDGSLPSPVLFKNGNGTPSVNERSDVFKETAISLALDAIMDAFDKCGIDPASSGVTHLITVTCTGLYAPGIDSILMEKLGLPEDTFHTAMNFLGCNAAFPALKLADLIIKSDIKARVLIVCVELCTLHFQPKNDHNNLLSNTIFSDGAAAVVLSADTEQESINGGTLSLNGFYSILLDKGKDLMSWNITPLGYEMVLDAKVPEFIGGELNKIVARSGIRFNLTPGAIDQWAIHPGGKKILDIIRQQLGFIKDELKYSYRVLDEYGNMSSPTILFVLNEILKDKHRPGENIFAIGFGPGLSIETAMFTHA